MSISNISRLRHDLRTPVNHLLGYSQLLIEDAQGEADDSAWKPQIRKVASLGEDIKRTIETLLPATDNDIREERLAELRAALEQPLQQIQGALHSIALPDEAPQGSDIRKLLVASGKLIHFAATGVLARPAESPAAGESTAVPERKPGSARLLLVDDDLSNREVLGRMLTRLGYEVFLAADGAEALALAQKNPYDLVLLDILMPGINGYEVLQSLKTSVPHLPVVMITAVGEMKSLVECIELGAEDYFLKPFEPLLLRARISATLNRARRRPAAPAQPAAGVGGEFATIASREIRTPLNFVVNFADVAADTLLHLRQALDPCGENVEALLGDLAQSISAMRKHGGRAEQALSAILVGTRREGTG